MKFNPDDFWGIKKSTQPPSSLVGEGEGGSYSYQVRPPRLYDLYGHVLYSGEDFDVIDTKNYVYCYVTLNRIPLSTCRRFDYPQLYFIMAESSDYSFQYFYSDKKDADFAYRILRNVSNTTEIDDTAQGLKKLKRAFKANLASINCSNLYKINHSWKDSGIMQ